VPGDEVVDGALHINVSFCIKRNILAIPKPGSRPGEMEVPLTNMPEVRRQTQNPDNPKLFSQNVDNE